ncbi:MAG: ribosomal protein S18-alanine N-acetyltransferase [Clostridia bacterium]
MNVQIEQAEIKDLEDIFEIENASFATPMARESLVEDLSSVDNTYYILAKLMGKTVGFAGIRLMYDHADVISIAVLDSYRGKHIGAALLEALNVKCIALDFEKIFLEVRVSNAVAISLYRQAGYVDISIRKEYYTDNLEDALIMMKEI